jgi:membrane carboxypeptidase/penicillin-binding protein PbpC
LPFGALVPHNFQRRLADAIVYPAEIRSLRILARRFFRVVRASRNSTQSPGPFLPETGSELASRAGQKPIIVSPNSKEILFVSTKTIPLRAKADADVREIFWLAGKQFVGKAAPNQVLGWTATAGDYEVTALDDHGRARSHSVVVR